MKYRPEIDGLRAFAVLPVVVFHANWKWLSGGFIGVDVFFVISGYLITGILLEELKAGQISIAGFYERRARRILPALAVVLVASALLAWWMLLPGDLVMFGRSLMAVSLFGSNVLFWSESGYFDTAAELKPLLHTWSLGVEEQFYLGFPLLLLALQRVSWRTMAWVLAGIAVASLSFADWASIRYQSLAFFLLPTRAWELIFGALLAIYMRQVGVSPGGRFIRDGLALAGLLMILVGIWRFSPGTPFPGRYALLPVLGTCLVIAFASADTGVGRLLGHRLPVGIGLVSYSLYLWHQPLFALARQRAIGEPAPSLMAALTLLALVLAVLTWRFVELPTRAWGRSVPQATDPAATRKQVLMLAGSASAALVMLGLAMVLVATHWESAVPTFARAEHLVGPEVLQWAEHNSGPTICRDGLIDDSRIESCRFGVPATPGRPVNLIVWGDSLAKAMFHGLDLEFKARGLTGVMYTVGGCPPLLGVSNSNVPDCAADIHAKILQNIVALPGPQPVLLHGNLVLGAQARNVRLDGLPTSLEGATRAMAAARAMLNRTGRPLIVLQQGPTFAHPAAAFVVKAALIGETRGPVLDVSQYQQSMDPIKGVYAAADGLIETVRLFCEDMVCNALGSDGVLRFKDTNHVTPNESERLARYTLDELSRSKWGKGDLALPAKVSNH